jgi:hypothetical protein
MDVEALEKIKSLITQNINQATTFQDLNMRINLVQKTLQYMQRNTRVVYPVQTVCKKDKLY